MKVIPVRTALVEIGSANLFDFLDLHLTNVPVRSVVAVTSKIVSICQGRVVPINKISKSELVAHEADYYLPKRCSKYDVMLSVKSGLLTPSAGIDESNGNNHYILWPDNPQLVANQIRNHISQRFNIAELGVMITDSIPTPLRSGVVGISIAHSGFRAIKNRIGIPDLFGRPLEMTKMNIADGLASAAVLTMGESNEQTPLAILTDLAAVEFTNANPSEEELLEIQIAIEDDLYAPLLTAVPWEYGSNQSAKSAMVKLPNSRKGYQSTIQYD